MNATRELAHLTCQLPTPDLPRCCAVALVIDGDHVELAHEVACPVGVTSRG